MSEGNLQLVFVSIRNFYFYCHFGYSTWVLYNIWNQRNRLATEFPLVWIRLTVLKITLFLLIAMCITAIECCVYLYAWQIEPVLNWFCLIGCYRFLSSSLSLSRSLSQCCVVVFAMKLHVGQTGCRREYSTIFLKLTCLSFPCRSKIMFINFS